MSESGEGQQPSQVDALEQRVSSLGQKLESAPSASPESEQQQAREKMGALIDKLDASVKDKGVIAQVVGEINENGDQRAAILTDPIIQVDADGNRKVGYVALTPDGPMVIDTSDSMSNGRAVFDFMARDIGPEDYQRQREYLKGLRYKSETFGSMTAYKLEGSLGFRPTNIFMQPVERSQIKDVNVESQFEKSVAKAAKPLEGARSQAADTVKLADSLATKF